MSTSVDPATLTSIVDTHAEGSSKEYKPDAELNARIAIWRGDITKLKADMIVNAANRSLMGGGGVDGAIHRAAGKELLKECAGLGGANTGETKLTKGYNLPSKFIGHTVGPIYNEDRMEESARLLKSCYQSALELCAENGGGSIGFPSISSGIYGYPIRDATHIALKTTREFLEKNDSIKHVVYVVFLEKDEKVYNELAAAHEAEAEAEAERGEGAKEEAKAEGEGGATGEEEAKDEGKPEAKADGEEEAKDEGKPEAKADGETEAKEKGNIESSGVHSNCPVSSNEHVRGDAPFMCAVQVVGVGLSHVTICAVMNGVIYGVDGAKQTHTEGPLYRTTVYLQGLSSDTALVQSLHQPFGIAEKMASPFAFRTPPPITRQPRISAG
ncbi:hypothetical protein CspHIS471_0603100 [Cutaneotrichosporon sp. HIS471]|nr:hypothetical protein CspHIS471_0603100 [Cutaneotrichosporon sp. HIS471]